MAVTHLLPLDRFPLTKCGVDVQVKTGAQYVFDEEEGWEEKVTCSNCLKLMHGGQMGAPPPRQTPEQLQAKQVEKELDMFEDRIQRLYRYREKVVTSITKVQFLISNAMSEEETAALTHCQQFLEAAKEQVTFAIGEVQIMEEQIKG